MIEGLGEDTFRGLASFFHEHFTAATAHDSFVGPEAPGRGGAPHFPDHTETTTVANPDGTTTRTTTVTHPDGSTEKRVQICHQVKIPTARGRSVEWITKTVCKDVTQ